jgi:hypothetical protein
MLAGCGGSQPPIGAPGTMPQSGAHKAAGSYSALLYVASGPYDAVDMYTFPAGKYVGKITLPGVDSAYGMCSDSSGDVFVTTIPPQPAPGSIYEYSYGGTTPIATLADGDLPYGCSWDPTTGNLAVANLFPPGGGSFNGNVAIYPQAQGTPTIYTDSAMSTYYNVAYDNQGNLFVTGQGDGTHVHLAELPFGSSRFTNIAVNKRLTDRYWIAWDGTYLATMIGGSPSRGDSKAKIIRLSIKGSQAVVEGTTKFTGMNNHPGGGFALYVGSVAVPLGEVKHKWSFGIYPYPGGGNPNVVDREFEIQSLSVAVDPSRSRLR